MALEGMPTVAQLECAEKHVESESVSKEAAAEMPQTRQARGLYGCDLHIGWAQ
jgi:hypothetical protein